MLERLRGQREELLEVVIDPALLETYGINVGQLLSAVAANNRSFRWRPDASSAVFNQGAGVIETAEDLFGIPVKTDGDTVVTLSDVATIRRTFKDRTSSRVNGVPAISVGPSGLAPPIDTVARVRATVEAMRAEFLPV